MKVIVHPDYAAWKDEISRIPDCFDSRGETLYQGRNTVKRFRRADTNWVVKRYKRPNPAQRVAYTFFEPSKAERAYRYAHLLKEKGISTPEGIAYIERKKHGLLCEYYFISTECTDRLVYPELVETPAYDRTLADKLAAFLVRLHESGVLHGDLNLNNILYRTTPDGEYRFSVIDTNRSHFKDNPTPEECLDNLKRVTHRRDLLEHIVGRYAELRGWNREESIRTVMDALLRFEKRRAWKRRLTGKKP